MHQWSILELQGVAARCRASNPRTTQEGESSWSSRSRRESGCCCPPWRAPLWVWLLLGAFVVPGAWSYLSEEQEELLVELHNHYRGQVSPNASAMLPLKWDSSLKVIAQEYAKQCVWNHNPELEDTGENLFVGTKDLDLRVALEKWFLEHLDYDFQNNSCDEDKMCGHYTQMVWADTHRVGCAYHHCNTMEGLGWERVFFLVCNYYPAGNYEGERPYVEGDWCSRCPENMQNCENNLCGPDAEEEDDDVTVHPSIPPADAPLPPSTDAPLTHDEAVSLQPNDDEVTPPPATTAEASPPSLTTKRPNAEEEDDDDVDDDVDDDDDDDDVTVHPSIPPADAPLPPSTDAPLTHDEAVSLQPNDDEVTPPPATTAEASPPPETTAVPLRGVEEEEEEEQPQKERNAAAEKERSIEQKIQRSNKVSLSEASVVSPSVLLACLTGILTVWL